MSFVPYWSRTRLRTTWGSTLALVLVIGLAGGTVLALTAGGLRTDSAYPRFSAQYRAADATMFQYSNGPDMVAAIAKVVRFPMVAAYGRIQGYDQKNGTTVGAPLGRGFEHTVGVPRLLSGRLPTAPDEIALDWTVADRMHERVGDTYRAVLLSNENGRSVTYPLRVVGIAANTLNFPPYSSAGAGGVLLVTSSFIANHEAELGQPSIGIMVRLHGGEAAVPAFARAVVAQFPDAPMIVQGSALQTAAIVGAIHPAAIALWLLGGSLALVAIFVLFQLLGRLSAAEEDPYTTALALGASRRQLAAVELVRTVAIGLIAAALAVVTAVALSPIFPLGTARVAEPEPGVAMNAFVLGVGAVVIVLLTAALAAWPGWRTTRDAGRLQSWQSRQAFSSEGSAWSPRWLWLRPVVWMGAVHGLRAGKGASSVPVRASVVSLVVAASGLAAALTFGASLNHMLATPAMYGWTWDAHIYDAGNAGTGNLKATLVADPWLRDVDLADTGLPLRIAGHTVEGVDFEQEKGAVSFIITEGRKPSGSAEIALTSPLMRQLGVHLGSHVPVQVTAVDGPTRMLTVVGQQVGPAIATSTSGSNEALMSRNALLAFVPQREKSHVPTTTDAFVDFAPGAETPDHMAQLQHQMGTEYRIFRAEPPVDILSFGRVQNLPVLLALLLTGLAVATLLLTLVSSARRRRRDLAVLKSLGYRPRQLAGVVVCQSTAMTVVGLMVGIPLGIAVGRWLWILVGSHLGILTDTVIPTGQIAVMALAALIAANLAAAWPGWVAARTPAGLALQVT
jgi:FtsX-like permease family